jgi:cell division initiation protein
MSITPDDLRNVKFAQSKRGYDTEAVDKALDRVADSIEQLLAERQQLVERVQHAEAELERYRGMEASLTQTLAMAERGAEQLKAEATAEAQRIVAAAQQRAGAAGSVPPDAMVQLLGETRAIRSLLQAVLTQGVPPMQGPPPGWQPPPAATPQPPR